LVSIGFKHGKASPCLLYHQKRQIRALVHGGDYVAVAEPEDLKWLRERMKSVFEIHTKVFGPDETEEEEKAISVLGRIIEWREDGVAYEADPRHAGKLIKEFNLENAHPREQRRR
jgi:hypothetical protein